MKAWTVFCRCITLLITDSLLRRFGYETSNARLAWREKWGLLSIIALLCASVGFITFGLDAVACPDRNQITRIHVDQVSKDILIIHGRAFNMSGSLHPTALGVENGDIHSGSSHPGVAKDASFLFQNVNAACLGILRPTAKSRVLSKINAEGYAEMAWYFPCVLRTVNGSLDQTAYTQNPPYRGYNCHTTIPARTACYSLKPIGHVYYMWSQIPDPTRNLVVYASHVLDLDLLRYIDDKDVIAPAEITAIASGKRNPFLRGRDISRLLTLPTDSDTIDCLVQITRVGSIDAETVGCLVSTVVLYLALAFILSIVLVKFLMALYFEWFLADTLKYTPENDSEQRRSEPRRRDFRKREERSPILPKHPFAFAEDNDGGLGGFVHEEVVPQPPPEYHPYPFPLLHTLCLVTAYSESTDGLRKTLDSIATSTYPNSHKLILVIADGLVTGTGEHQSTPELVLSMMSHIEPDDKVTACEYVAVANGTKRLNMARLYSGFYEYNDATVHPSKQQRVPMITIVKCGSASELVAEPRKAGNRGKRDSQVILMSFLQKVCFDERMTALEYALFAGLWKITGIQPKRYETLLMVDADTVIAPDALTHMVSCMSRDPAIMGLCGETKIRNPFDSWVTMIQVFEYYISHHLTKAFESVFGGVTCLPGCFSMYRIKVLTSRTSGSTSNVGRSGYSPSNYKAKIRAAKRMGTSTTWSPILANPDMVERYSQHIVTTLHEKNLLLLGEDRFLSTLLLQSFPRRKMVFTPSAICHTTVPGSFKVLLSQRRRWINSTVHNLFELMLVRDLCGTFCFSLQFVIFIELVGTLVLPAAITFTFYLLVISTYKRPIPVIPLCLLALILGLPGFLIVLTSRRWTHLGWMVLYILALPIWNGVLPLYAYYHFDDFSWGDTRTIEGAGKKEGEGGHGDIEGEFEGDLIVMKRWREWERDLRIEEDEERAEAQALAEGRGRSRGDDGGGMSEDSRTDVFYDGESRWVVASKELRSVMDTIG